MRRFFKAESRPSRSHAGLAFLSGGVLALGQAPWSLWYLALLGCAMGIGLFTRQNTASKSAWLGWFFGTGYFALALFWIIEPFLVDLARHGWMAPFALIFLAGGLALIWGAAFGVAARFRHRVAALIILLTLAEMLRAVLFTGFPWATVGHIWIDSKVLQLAAYGGAPLLSFLALAIAALPSMMRPIWGVVSSVVLLGICLALGFVAGTAQYKTSGGPIVRLVQPNAAQHLKWKADQVPIFFNRMLEMTRKEGEADLIIWPETAVAYRLDRADDAIAAMAEAAGGTPLVFGVNDLVGSQYRNTLGLIGSDGAVAQTYYKHHLVPFGEYVPFGDLLGRIGIRGLAARDGAGYGAGEGPKLIEIEGIGKALPLICYELIFPRNLRTDTRPDVILQITNDAWFGNYSGPYQHLAQARLRAVEQGLPVIRSANTGISAVIGPTGRVLAATGLNEAMVLDFPLPDGLAPTFYARMGDIVMLVLLIVALGVLFTARRAKVD